MLKEIGEIETIEDKPKKINKILVTYQDSHSQTEINEYLRCLINELIEQANTLLEKLKQAKGSSNDVRR